MLAIRMRRMGAKKRPFFRLVVTDSAAARDSSFVEVLGYYDPRARPEKVEINAERFEHWLKVGAQPSDTVRTLIGRHRSGKLVTPTDPLPGPTDPTPKPEPIPTPKPVPVPEPGPMPMPELEAEPAHEPESEPEPPPS